MEADLKPVDLGFWVSVAVVEGEGCTKVGEFVDFLEEIVGWI